MYDEFFTKAHELLEQGEPFATATVVRAERPTSGKPGDKAIVTLSGVMFGWIGGSCAQPTVVSEALAALADGESRLIRITPEPGQGPPREGLKEVAMTCYSGGTLDIYIEPQRPRPWLMIIGHLPVAQALAHLGRAMSYHTIAVDAESGGAAMAHADVVLTDLDQIGTHINASTYVIVATHGHYDEPALERALRCGARYVGLVASRKRAQPIVDYLRGQGLSDRDLEPLKVPAGLDLGARRGDEIALSIMAEIVQLRHRAEALEIPGPEAPDEVPEEAKASEPATAIDPICGMSVATEGAAHTFEHQGVVYYFCCGGCKSRFAAEPESYLAAG